MDNEPIIAEMCVATSVCPHPELWHAFDNMATELEVINFLRALVITLKPKMLIETGCYHGHATEQLALGMMQNGFGELYTCDLGSQEGTITAKRVESLGQIVIYQCSGIDMITDLSGPIDFAFLDSGPDEIRCHELRALYPKLSPGAVVAIHDSGIQGFLREKYLPPLLRELDMQFIMFDTPRGLCLCRKKPEVYP